MKKNFKYIIIVSLLVTLIAGCERFDFNKEVYESVVYLLSDNDEFNIYDRAIADLNNDIDTLYITVGVSGSTGSPADIPIVLKPFHLTSRVDSVVYDGFSEEDRSRLFYQYNKSHFDITFSEWTNFLPEDNYDFLEPNRMGNEPSGMVNLKTLISAGNDKTTIPVIVKNLNNLSPDSIYFIDYQIESAGKFEINNKKNNVLIPIYWKNNWSNTKQPVSYNMYGEQFQARQNSTVPSMGTERAVTGSPVLFPLSKNEIRIAAGIESIEKKDGVTAREQIDNNSIVLKVNDDNTVEIKPYKNILAENVEEDSPFYDKQYPNNFFIDKQFTTSGIPKYFKTFKIQYRYRLKKGGGIPVWTYVKCKLSYEFQPEAE